MKAVIADDEALARALLRGLLAAHSDIEIVGEAADGDTLLDVVREHGADLVLTDIDMPGIDGLAAASRLSHIGGPDIIFVTAYDRYATAAFDVDAVDYLLKPVRRHRLDSALDRARRRCVARAAMPVGNAEPRSAEEGVLWVHTRHKLVRVNLAEIDRIEAAGDHVYLHSAEHTWLHRITMKEVESLLNGGDLRRVHRSTFVRLAAIRAVDRRGRGLTLILADGAEVPVGPNYRTALAAVFPPAG
ncbi:LytTR family DNA-binding domain-containing protein [Sphingomonas sp.]|uniref:LytR/AlgR family response regulator transcription factor n=1 Tax=Sphingomonas sp. TaxID=28214 RepID=UPI001ED2FACA|nr:LytTR family DNA-binding domain-containing protein [Sphingomonas sp.]MBX3593817.1 response regulator transcription factor [Sphingomonas sp.]